MNEQLQQALQQLITQSLEAFKAGATFLQAEIPDVVHQLLLWYAVKSSVFFVLAAVLAVVLVIVEYKVGRKVWNSGGPGDREAFFFGYCLLGSIPRFIAWSLVGYFFNLTWLQIWLAPKVWLIEYAAGMIK